MRIENRALAVPATGQTGAAMRIEDLTDCAVTIDGTGAGAFSVKVQAKMSTPQADGPWIDITAALTATTVVPLDRAATSDLGGYSLPWTHVRLVSTTTGA